jgi:polysaccharide export outer membrane protein
MSGDELIGNKLSKLHNDIDFMRFILLTVIMFISSVSTLTFAQENAPVVDSPKEAAGNYRLHQGDKLSIKFLYHPELNETSLTVRPDGFISLQMIDDLKAEGLTVSELKKQLDKAYDEILIKPVITVTVLEFVAPHIFIGGQIGKPGRYELRDGQTLIQVIFLAGGFTPDANRKMVMHARADGKGDWQFQSINAMKILNPKPTEKDLVLQNGDYIFIPESKISQITKAVEGFRGLLPRFF